MNECIRIRSKTKYFVFLCIYYFLYPLCFVLYGRKNNWLICERGDDAQDNGYVFYKYVRENHPKINITYLINKDSKDYDKLASIGKVVEFGSLKHFLMMIGCPVKISSHLYGYSPLVNSTLYYRRHKTHHKHIFLQHGITKNDIPSFYSDVCKSLSLFVCGAKPEYEYVKSQFGYKDGVVVYTGFPRYDLLDDYKTNNHILIMPTWRRYLSGLSDKEFIDTEFYKEWFNLLSNKVLIDACKKNDMKIDLYLHHEIHRYSHLFKSTDVFNVIDDSNKTVQELLKESSLLVTDFSSVFFDFAYMKKPIVFFQFDENKYNKEHYQKGWFDYRRDGFGEVCVSLNDVVSSISSIISNNFVMEDKYLSRVSNNFTLEKGHNRERVFNRIIELINK